MDSGVDPSPASMEVSTAIPLAEPETLDPPLNKERTVPDGGQRSWKSVLFPSGKSSKIFKLRFIPPSPRDDSIVGVCSKESVKGELVLLDLTLVGFFLGKRPAFSFVRAALLRQWKLRGNVEILQLLHGGFAFRFSDVRDRDDILEGEAFYIGGQPMFIRKWERNLHSGGILGLKSVPLWITLPGLPLHLWGEEALSSICSVLGNPLYADKTTAMKSRLAYARICVEFKGENPLLENVTIEDDMGLLYNQKVVYEWKPPQCLKCGVFGHVGCGINEVHLENNPNEPVHRAEGESRHHYTGKAYEKGTDGSKEVLIFPAPEKAETRAELHDVEGWEAVRARKKRPMRFGAPYPPKTRPGQSRGVREAGGDLVVSTPYWSILNSASEKVPSSALELNMANCLNTKSCSEDALCPLSLNSGLDVVSESAGQVRSPLNSGKLNDVSSPHWPNSGPLEDQLLQHDMNPPMAGNLKFKRCPEKEISHRTDSIQQGVSPNGVIMQKLGEGMEKGQRTGAAFESLTSEKSPKMSPSLWSNLAHLNAKVPKTVGTQNGTTFSNSEKELMDRHLNPSHTSEDLQSEPSKGVEQPHKYSPSSAGKNWPKDLQSKADSSSRSAPKAGDVLVSTPHGTKWNLPTEKVPSSAPSTNMEIFLKSKSCVGAAMCPPSLNTSSNGMEAQSGQGTVPFTFEKEKIVSTFHWRKTASKLDCSLKDGLESSGVENLNFEISPEKDMSPTPDDQMKSPIHPSKLVAEPIQNVAEPGEQLRLSGLTTMNGTISGPTKGSYCLRAKPGPAGSTAGHTPFKSRLTSLARDLKSRKAGPSCGFEKTASFPSSEDRVHHPPSLLGSAGPIGSSRVISFQHTSLANQKNGMVQQSSLSSSSPVVRNSGVVEDIIQDGMVLNTSEVPHLQMEMPKYMQTRKLLMEQHQMTYIPAKEKPMMVDDTQESDDMRTAPLFSQLEFSSPIPTFPGHEDDNHNGKLGPDMKTLINSDFKGCEEPEVQLDENERMGCALGSNSDLELEEV